MRQMGADGGFWVEGGRRGRRTSGCSAERMRRTGEQVDRAGQVDEWTGANTGRTGERAEEGGLANEQTRVDWLRGLADEPMEGPMDGWGGGWVDWRTSAQGQTVADGFPKDKTPKLTHQLTWPLEIQRGRPRVTIQIGHLPPMSR